MKVFPWIASAAMMAGIVVYALRLDRKTEVPDPTSEEQLATFAGGCYWCMEAAFEGKPGVRSVISGWSGHREAVQLIYDPSITTYEQLLDIYWRRIDPTDSNGQFVDRGSQYSTAILYHNESQRLAAIESRQQLIDSGRFEKKIVTKVEGAGRFHPAKEHEQDYHSRNPVGYGIYHKASGRDKFFRNAWK